jgi:small GTP-binding protein
MSGILKLVLLGDHGVGKTCLVSRWSKNVYRPDQPATIGAAFSQRDLQLDGEVHKLQIWDTAGEERYHSMAPIYSQGAVGAFLVFDVTSRQTLDHIANWQKCLESCDPNVRVMVIGNKADCENREVSFNDGEAVAERLGFDYGETSAATGAGVEDVFLNLTQKAIQARDTKPTPTEIRLTPKPRGSKESSGCC